MIGRDVFDQACEWIVRLDSGAARASERSEFVRWLNKRPEHRAAYEEMSQLWARMGTLGDGAARPRDEAEPQLPIQAASWFYSFRGALAASLAVILLMIATVVFTDPQPGSIALRHFVTAAGQAHHLTAPDGSQISLEEMTAVTLDYSRGRRLVRLERGEIAIRATHLPQRPFTVVAADAVIQALGTEFRVGLAEGRVSVEVTEGSVSFSSSDAKARRSLDRAGHAGTSAVVLEAGQSMEYGIESHRIEVRGPGEPSASPAGRE